MSYTSAAPTGATGQIQVGERARHDVILARASLAASQLLMESTRRPASLRSMFLRDAMRQYGPGSVKRFDRERQVLLARGQRPRQATYDAMRLVAANHYAQEGLDALRAAAAQVSDADQAGLGDDGLAIGCGITGGATALLAIIGGAYTAGVAAPIVGAGGSAIAGAIGCNAASQASQQQIAAAQAAQAASIAAAAEAAAAQEAAAEERVRAEQTKTLVTMGAIGGGLLLLLGVGYAIIKV